MNRPKIKLTKTFFDQLIETVSVLLLIVLFIHPASIYTQLPEKIPGHYGISGNPDSFSSMGGIWILPILGLFFYAGFTILNRYPHFFNYPVKVIKQNAEGRYIFAAKSIRIMKFLILAVFFYINYQTITYSIRGGGAWAHIFCRFSDSDLLNVRLYH